MAKKPSLKVQERVAIIDGEPIKLRADFNAMYTLEQETGRNLFEIVGGDQSQRVYTTVAQLLYALSATHREDTDTSCSFKAFMRKLPSIDPEELTRLSEIAFGLVHEALTGEKYGAAAEKIESKDASAADAKNA